MTSQPHRPFLVTAQELAPGDYVAPGLEVVRPDRCFPHMVLGDKQGHPWPYLRREIPHNWYVDERKPLMGFINRDEAALLFNIARAFAGRPALEVGCWLGWSSCHLALGGVELDVVDPVLADPEHRARIDAALACCGVADRARLHATASPEGVREAAASRPDGWSLFFVDGDHEALGPELRRGSSVSSTRLLDCAFVFHDLASPHVAEGLRLLEARGFNVLLYQTMQIMGFAWRGNCGPVPHVPDPAVVWQLPHHLAGLPVAGVESAGLSGQVTPAPERAGAGHGRGAAIARRNYPRPVDAARTTGSADRGAGDGPAGLARTAAGAMGRMADVAPMTANAYLQFDETASLPPGEPRPRVCIVTSELVGPFKNGGIGTSMTGLAETLAGAGFPVAVFYTGALWSGGGDLETWRRRYERIGVELLWPSREALGALTGPVAECGFGSPYLVYEFLRQRSFDVVHFNDCLGEGFYCLAMKRLGAAFQQTLLCVAMHSPSQWVYELDRTTPATVVGPAFNYAERLSTRCATWSGRRAAICSIGRRRVGLPTPQRVMCSST